MDHGPAEVVFALDASSSQPLKHEAVLFRYTNGPVKVPGPWKRGRPRGAKQSGGDTSIRTRPQFEFVQVSPQSKEVDALSRVRIRRHAKLNQNRRQGLRPEVRRSSESGEQLLNAQSNFKLQEISGIDPFDTSPFRLEPYMYDLLVFFHLQIARHLYSLEHMAGCSPLLEYWLPLAFQDAALLHCFIGCADVYRTGYQTVGGGIRGLRHMNAAISILNQRLMSPSKTMINGTLAIVAAVAMLEKGSDGHAHWKIHMKGLKRLVDMHGGLESLTSSPLILEKIYRWVTTAADHCADLFGSIDSAEAPFFNKRYLFPVETPLEISFDSTGFQAIRRIVHLDKIICACLHQLEDAMPFWSDADSRVSNVENKSMKKKPSPAEAARVRHLLTNTQYTLVSVNLQRRAYGVEDPRIFELCRVTLLLYTLTMLDERPGSTSFGEGIGHIFRLALAREASQSHYTPKNASCTPWRSPLPVDFSLWAILLAASTVRATESQTKTWLLASFEELALSDDCDIRSWPELRSRLSKYLWVPSIHDPLSQWIWSEAMGNTKGIQLDKE